MYENFYGLKEKPFQIVPNPNYLYMSSVHENALTYLEYGLMENVGFILLTGKVGTGKTTLIRYIINQFESKKDIAVIFNTNVSANELVYLILQSFELKPDPDSKSKNIEMFYEFLISRYAQNRPVLLIIDEAQNLSDDVIEEIRMLSNLQSEDQSLIQIMLVGQPELKDRLQRAAHTPFAQRIAVNFFLSELTCAETEAYIAYRLEKAGGNLNIFSHKAIELIYKISNGIPRIINLICDTALVYGFGYEFATVDAPVIEQVIKDKGGLGIQNEKENTADLLPSDGNNEISEMYEDRLRQLEDVVMQMKGRVNDIIEQVKKLEGNARWLQRSLNQNLENLLVRERKEHNRLLEAYSKLKVKYDSLIGKLGKGNKKRMKGKDGDKDKE